MDAEIETLRNSITNAKAQEKLLRANLSSLNATLSTDELRAEVQVQRCQKLELEDRLKMLREGHVKPVSPEERAQVDKEWARWSTQAATRKKICMDMWAMLTEEVPEGMTREDLWVS